jgi:hypothetical protein
MLRQFVLDRPSRFPLMATLLCYSSTLKRKLSRVLRRESATNGPGIGFDGSILLDPKVVLYPIPRRYYYTKPPGRLFRSTLESRAKALGEAASLTSDAARSTLDSSTQSMFRTRCYYSTRLWSAKVAKSFHLSLVFPLLFLLSPSCYYLGGVSLFVSRCPKLETDTAGRVVG